MLRLALQLFMAVGISFYTAAQQSLPNQYALCGFTLSEQQQSYQLDVAKRRQQLEKVISQQIAYQKMASSARGPYILPVVVHVIHTGGAIGSTYNPSDATIQAMLMTLNNAWRKNGAVYGGVDMQIQFQLAIRNPGCTTTTGINRIDGRTLANYETGGITNIGTVGSVDEVAVKSLSRWPNTDYINIWIVNKINGSETGTAGYAYFPEFNSALTDGIVIRANAVDGANFTIAHEMGHVFALYHTFSDGGNETTCPINTTCAAQGDMVCDTEPHKFLTACTSTTNACTGVAFQVADAALDYTVLNNYMGYTNCQRMFTQGQKDRAMAALLAFRSGLISSGGLYAPAVGPMVACSFSATGGLSPYFGVQQVQLNTLTVYSNSSQRDGSTYIDHSCNQRTTLTKGQSYTLTVTGSYENYQVIRAYLDYNNDGDFSDPGETVLADAGGNVSAIVNTTGPTVALNTPLRLRILANYYSSIPTSCSMTAGNPDGAGQAEDYTVIITPPGPITSVTSGTWNSSATWSCGCVPAAGDTVIIKAGNVVTITNGIAIALKVSVYGKLNYTTSGTLTVRQ